MRKLPVWALALVLLAGCASAPVAPPVARSWELPPGVKAMPVNGYEMAYVERGSGVPLVLVHGAGGDYRALSTQLEPFANAGYRVISVSLRRYYPEPFRGEGEFSLNQQAADLAEFIRGLGQPAHVFGHSRGGTVVMYLAKNAPEVIRTLTIAEGGTGMPAFSKVVASGGADARGAMYRQVREHLQRNEVDPALEVFANFVQGPGGWKNTPDNLKQMLRDNAWTLVAAVDDDPRWAPFSCDDARNFRMPVLLVGGERSPATFGQTLDAIQACLPPTARRSTIANASHSMMRMNPTGFQQAVLEFLRAH